MSATLEFLVELHDITAAEGAAGKQVRIPIQNVPTHLNGWPVHCMQLTFRPTLQVDTNVAMPNAFDGHHQLSLVQALSFGWGRDHQFISGLTGLDAHKENRIRQSQAPADPSDIADATASDVTSTITFQINLCHPDAPVESRYDGAVPVQLLSQDFNMGTKLHFQVGTAALPAIASVTVDQITGKVYMRCVALPKVRIPPPMKLQVVEDTKKTLAYRPFGPIEYLAVVDREDSSNAFVQHQGDYDNFNFSRDNQLLVSGKNETFLSIRHNDYRSYRSPAAFGTENQPEYMPLVGIDESHRRTRMSRHNDSYRLEILDTRGGRGQTRVMWREIGLWNNEYSEMIKQSLGIPQDAAGRMFPVSGSDSVEHLQIMDRYWFWEGMDASHGFAEPATRLDRVFSTTNEVQAA